MVMRAHHFVCILLHQERHWVDRASPRRRIRIRRIAVGADERGQPELRAIRTRAPPRRTRNLGQGNDRHDGTFQQSHLGPKITAMSEQDILAAIRFDAAGLVPAIAQQHDTGEVLMLAWMNRDAVTETLATKRVCYFSRSRNALWRKGETSGQLQHLKELRVDR